MVTTFFLLFQFVFSLRTQKLILDEQFQTFNFTRWKHQLTLAGGGNWEFQLYWNNRTTSYVKQGILYIKPTLTSDFIGHSNVMNGYTYNMWGMAPADYCTGNEFYGCQRTSGAGGNILNPISSARLRTAESFSFKYGRVEIRAKMPIGDWMWPALWMLPKNNEYGNWPASGEIDIAQSRGNLGYPIKYGGGPESFGSTLHWGPAAGFDPFEKTHKVYSLESGTLNDDFHVYGLYWDQNMIYTYLDHDFNRVLQVDTLTTSFWEKGNFPSSFENPWQYSPNKIAPFDAEYYLVMNVAVGGVSGYFPDGVGGKVWSNDDSHAVNAFYDAQGAWYPTWDGEKAALQVDSVKVWSFEDSYE